MKRLIALLSCFLICFAGLVVAESPATQTDLCEIFKDDDYGYIEYFDRQVFLDWLKEPTYYGEEVTLVAILVNFQPTDVYTFEWEYSEDCEVWHTLDNEHEQTHTFIFDKTNYTYWWRVKVVLEEG